MNERMAFIIIYTTHENEQEARKITSQLLQDRLIACANIFPIKSAFWWEGRIDESDEVVAILKTRMENWQSVKEAVLKSHPYTTPCIMRIETEANEAYEQWIRNETETSR